MLSLNELQDCLPDRTRFDDDIESRELAELLNIFLRLLSDDERRVFICRYWFCDPISAISKQFGFGQSKVKMMLLRTRGKLRSYLEEKGVTI